MKPLLLGLAVLPLLAGGASAYTLSEAQLDYVTAGAALPALSAFDCPGCAFSTSSSTSNNGVTMTTSSSGVSGVVSPPAPPAAGGGGADGGNPLPGVAVPATATAILNALSAGATVIH
jgi:hypothetical protein